MGGTSVQCEHKPIKEKDFELKCYYGNIQPSKSDFGILSTALDKQTYCTNPAIWETTDNKGKAKCSDLMDRKVITDQLDKCAGKESC